MISIKLGGITVTTEQLTESIQSGFASTIALAAKKGRSFRCGVSVDIEKFKSVGSNRIDAAGSSGVGKDAVLVEGLVSDTAPDVIEKMQRVGVGAADTLLGVPRTEKVHFVVGRPEYPVVTSIDVDGERVYYRGTFEFGVSQA